MNNWKLRLKPYSSFALTLQINFPLFDFFNKSLLDSKPNHQNQTLKHFLERRSVQKSSLFGQIFNPTQFFWVILQLYHTLRNFTFFFPYFFSLVFNRNPILTNLSFTGFRYSYRFGDSEETLGLQLSLVDCTFFLGRFFLDLKL